VCGGALVCTWAHGGSTLERAAMCAQSHLWKSVCVNWAYALKPTRVSSRVGPCLGSSILLVRSIAECRNFKQK
jgi:hypothetical protein